MMRRLIGIGIGVVGGGLLGYSQVLCPDGSCALTGTWFGGAMMGGLLGMVVLGGCPACSNGTCDKPQAAPPDGSPAPPV